MGKSDPTIMRVIDGRLATFVVFTQEGETYTPRAFIDERCGYRAPISRLPAVVLWDTVGVAADLGTLAALAVARSRRRTDGGTRTFDAHTH